MSYPDFQEQSQEEYLNHIRQQNPQQQDGPGYAVQADIRQQTGQQGISQQGNAEPHSRGVGVVYRNYGSRRQ